MANVKNYKVQVQTDQIVRNLHSAAMNDAKVGEGSGFSLVNTLMLADNKVSGVNPQIMLTMEDGSTVESSRKKEFVAKIQEYIKFFAGENYSKMVDETDVHPIFNSRGTQEEPKPESNPEQEETTESRQRDRLFLNNKLRMISDDVDLFFGASKIIKEQEEQEEDEQTNENDMEIKGYAVDFLFYKGGEQVSILGGKSAKISKLFSGALADLANFKIATSYGSIPIGKYISKMSRAFRQTNININDVDNNIRNVIKNKMPQSSAIVRVYDCKSLQNNLMKTRQWRPEYDSLFKGCEYAVTIQVEKRDKAYEQYNKKIISEICTMAFGDANKIFKIGKNIIKENEVIKIDNYNSEYKSQSIYDRRNSGKDGASSTNENISDYFKYKTVGQIIESLFGDNYDDFYMIEESSSHTLNQISSDIFIPYIKKHGTTKFQWNKNQIDSAFASHYKGQKNGNAIKQVIDGMSKFEDIVEMAEHEPLVNFRKNTKDANSKNIINGVYVCIKNMFENTNPPGSKSPEGVKPEGVKPEEGSSDESKPGEGSSDESKPGEGSSDESSGEDNQVQNNSDISVRFLFKNPDKENPLEQTLSTYVIDSDDKFGKIPLEKFQNSLPRFNSQFQYWNPDPNEITKKNTEPGHIVDVRAVFSKDQTSNKSSQSDLYIIPNKNLVSNNRKDSYDIASDGTVTAKQNMSDYKNTDFQE